jgi:ribosome biogenesis GTPase
VLEGLVIKAVGNLYKVKTNNGQLYDCRIKGRLRILDIKSTNPVTVGDRVNFELDARSDVAGITEILDRKNYIIRKSSNLSRQSHIIAANVDQALLIVTLKEPETNTDFIDRFLVAAESFRITVIIVFNKIDIYEDIVAEKLLELSEVYKNIGYKVVHTSVTSNINLHLIQQFLQNKITVINGNSGVGKSSLIKAIDPSLDIKIGTISDYHKSGMHTTSFSEMFELNGGGYIIDTPGIKGFGLFQFYKQELFHYFPEIFKISDSCKFYNCTHIHEPGCAVIDAVKDGTIALSRYQSYFNLYHDSDGKYR